jgi:hypothetical protein
MQLPPLPEIFGNYAIRGIVEVLPPDPVSWFPSTMGWRLVAAVVLVLLTRMFWRRWQRWRFNRYRRVAVAQLRNILSQDQEPARQLSAISRLLKSTALQVYPRAEVAALSGEQWIAWLNTRVSEPLFPSGVSHLLGEAVFQRNAPVEAGDIEQLASTAQIWINRHAVPQHA